MLTTVTSILPVEEVVEEAPAPSSWGWKEVALGALLITVVVGGVVLGVMYFGNPLPGAREGLGQEVGKSFGPGAIRAYHSYIIREHGADIIAAISHVLEARNSFNSGGSVTTIKVTLKVGSNLLYDVHQALHAHYGHLHWLHWPLPKELLEGWGSKTTFLKAMVTADRLIDRLPKK